MAKLVFFNLPAYGHINPTLRLVEALVREGEEVVYYTGESFRGVVEQTGARVKAYPVPFEMNLVEVSRNIFYTARLLMDYSLALLPALLQEVEEEAPDYVMHDSLCIWGKAVAVHCQLPALGSSAILQPAVAGRPYRWPLAHQMGGMLVRGFPHLLPYFRGSWRLMKAYGMPFYFVPQAYINREGLNLLYTSRAFHPGAERLGDDYLLIGPPGSPPISREAFPFEQLEGKRVIYISLGTVMSADQAGFYQMCFEAFEETDALVVLSTGAYDGMDELRAPDNFLLRTFAPQPLLLPYVDLFVTHGGMNSIHDAMAAEVPMVVIPQTFEQTLNALRVAELELGLCLRKDRVELSASRLRDACEAVLEDAGYSRRLRQMKQSFEAAGGIERALTALKQWKIAHSLQPGRPVDEPPSRP